LFQKRYNKSNKCRERVKEGEAIKISFENAQSELITYIVASETFTIFKPFISEPDNLNIDYLFKDGLTNLFQKKPSKQQLIKFNEHIMKFIGLITNFNYQSCGSEFKKVISILLKREKIPPNYLWDNEKQLDVKNPNHNYLLIIYFAVVKTLITKILFNIKELKTLEEHFMRAIGLVLYRCVRDGDVVLEMESQFFRVLQYTVMSSEDANEWTDLVCKGIYKSCEKTIKDSSLKLYKWAEDIVNEVNAVNEKNDSAGYTESIQKTEI
jgi:hypothetical protein